MTEIFSIPNSHKYFALVRFLCWHRWMNLMTSEYKKRQTNLRSREREKQNKTMKALSGQNATQNACNRFIRKMPTPKSTCQIYDARYASDSQSGIKEWSYCFFQLSVSVHLFAMLFLPFFSPLLPLDVSHRDGRRNKCVSFFRFRVHSSKLEQNRHHSIRIISNGKQRSSFNVAK